MKTTDYKRFVMSRAAPPKNVKAAMRGNVRTNRLANAFHGVLGFKTETGEIVQGMTLYLLGHQLRPDMVLNLREEVGDAMFYLTLAAKHLKVKLPGFGKKVKLRQTPTLTLLQLDSLATDMLDVYKKTIYGKPLDEIRLKVLVEQALLITYGLSLQFFGKAPEPLIEENVAKLTARYPDGFNGTNAHNRDLTKEAAAAKAVKDKPKGPKQPKPPKAPKAKSQEAAAPI